MKPVPAASGKTAASDPPKENKPMRHRRPLLALLLLLGASISFLTHCSGGSFGVGRRAEAIDTALARPIPATAKASAGKVSGTTR
jgi:hypothetical protein